MPPYAGQLSTKNLPNQAGAYARGYIYAEHPRRGMVKHYPLATVAGQIGCHRNLITYYHKQGYLPAATLLVGNRQQERYYAEHQIRLIKQLHQCIRTLSVLASDEEPLFVRRKRLVLASIRRYW